MKKLQCFLCMMLISFASIPIVHALPIEVGHYPGLNDNDVTHPEYQDNLDNVNAVLDRYNEVNPSATLPSPIEMLKNVEAGDYGSSIIDRTYKPGETDEDEIIAGTLIFLSGTEYVSLKWDAANGGFSLWYVAGYKSLDFGTLSHGLSHYREWSSNPVPEPATILLLGAGLVGLVGFGKKKFSKK